MKKYIRSVLFLALCLSVVFTLTSCQKSEEPEESVVTPTCDGGTIVYTVTSDPTGNTTRSSLYTGRYELAVPTGTREMSDDPELPEEIVYWDPNRDLSPEYTLEEATEKYAFVADHTTLIYNSCDEISMTHTFRCVDYGSRLFSNSNSAQCLDPDGNIHEGRIKSLQLNVLENGSVYTPFEEMAHDPMCYFRIPPYEFEPEEIELTNDHVIQHITETENSREFLYYGKVMGKNLLAVTFENYNIEDPLTETDIRDFIHYAEVLLDHLEADNGSEAYIYDKIVNTPILAGMHVTGFNHLTSISRNRIGLESRNNTILQNISLTPGADKACLEDDADGNKWTDMGDLKSKDGYAGNQYLFFEVGNETYLCSIYNPNGKSTVFTSVLNFLDVFCENCYVA